MRLRTLVMQGGWETCKGCGRRISHWPYNHDTQRHECPLCHHPLKRHQ